MKKICKKCNINFEITQEDLKFYNKISPVFAGKKYEIPSPTLCPDCRQQRRLSFRNERRLYKRKCDFSGKEIVSIYSPDKDFKVYSINNWLSDKWDALDYGQDFDDTKLVFNQFNELLKKVPKIPLFQSLNENSEYTNGAQKNKDCYMIFVSDYNENCYYGNGIGYSKNILDCLGINKSENCYECIDCDNCYNCFYSKDLVDCRNCFNSIGLIGKEFFINNKEFSRDEYLFKIKI